LLPDIVRRLLLLFLFASLSVSALCAATAASAGVKVTGARSSSNLSTGETVYSGDATQRARLEDSDLLLLADEIRYAPSSGVAIAIGNVGLSRGPLHLLADKITYFATTRVYSVIGPRFTLRSLNVT
jgi:lipopolysaccharide export system protein LptA